MLTAEKNLVTDSSKIRSDRSSVNADSAGQRTESSPALPGTATTRVVRGLCFVALIASGYLAWSSLYANEVFGCGGGQVFDCGHVLNSKWAKLFGISVSVPAVALYGSLLCVLSFMTTKAPLAIQKAGWSMVTFGGIAAGLAALWFIGLQTFVLKHFCPYCLAAHACGLTLAAIMLYQRPVGNRLTSLLAGASVAATAVLVTGQVMGPTPPTYVEETFGESSTSDLAGLAGDSESDSVPTDEVFAPPGGLFEPPAGLFEPPPVAMEPQPADSTTVSEGTTVGEGTAESPPAADSDTGTVSETEAVLKNLRQASGIEFVSPSEQPSGEPATADENAPQSRGSEPSVVSTLLLVLPVQTSGISHLLWQESPAEETNDDEPADSGNTTGSSETDAPPAPIVSVADDKIRLDARHWPLLGKSDAPYIFVEMFDYTCPHCRNTHNAIKGAFERYGDDLAVIALPVPLNRKCNSAATGGAEHTHACEIAELAVAVWRTKPAAYRDFHDWVFLSSANTQPTVARKKAEELVGADALKAELANPYAGQYIAKHVELYKRVGAGTVPKLMFPKSTISGEMSSTSELCQRIEAQLVRK